MIKTKYCPNCKEVKRRIDFAKCARRSDGLRAYCKICERARFVEYNKRTNYHANYYQAKRETRLEKAKQWAKDNRLKVNTYMRNYRKNSIVWEKTKARIYVLQAIRKGKITKAGKCQNENCTITVRLEAHHSDYSKPLDVIWLCHKHHLQITNKSRRKF